MKTMGHKNNYIRVPLKAEGEFPQLGRYKVLKQLGRGGMGAVYHCQDTVGGIEVAVKTIPAEFLDRPNVMEEFKANFQLTSTLIHQNIAACLNLEETAEGNYCVVMELVKGDELGMLMRTKRKSGGISFEEALPILRQVAAALDYAHGRGVMHRDVKPGNIMVNDDGVVKVLDFGLAARIPKDPTQVPVDVRAKSGTPMYMSPEQWLGQPQGAASDQYALAVTAYEMLAGHLPFESSNSALLRNMVLNVEPPAIETVPKKVNAVLAKGMAKKPGQRFASCKEFVCALENGMRQKGKGMGVASFGGIKMTFFLLLLLLALAGVRYSQLRSQIDTPNAQIASAKTISEEPKAEPLMLKMPENPKVIPKADTPSKETGAVAGVGAEDGGASSESGTAKSAEVAVVPDIEAYLFVNLETGKWEYSKEAPNVEDDRCRTVELWLRRIPQNSFRMGGENQHHEVTLTADFYIGVFEVTKAQWELIMENNSSFQGDMRPVDSVSYNNIRGGAAGATWPRGEHAVDADSFLGKLRAKTHLDFDLPTVAQWEYACRAGDEKDVCLDLNGMAWYVENAGNGAHKVGTLKPNAWGLYDMFGNVSEICLDWYVRGWIGGDRDPVGPPKGQDNMRSVCGTNWRDEKNRNRPTWRAYQKPETAEEHTGLRLVLNCLKHSLER